MTHFSIPALCDHGQRLGLNYQTNSSTISRQGVGGNQYPLSAELILTDQQTSEEREIARRVLNYLSGN